MTASAVAAGTGFKDMAATPDTQHRNSGDQMRLPGGWKRDSQGFVGGNFARRLEFGAALHKAEPPSYLSGKVFA